MQSPILKAAYAAALESEGVEKGLFSRPKGMMPPRSKRKALANRADAKATRHHIKAYGYFGRGDDYHEGRSKKLSDVAYRLRISKMFGRPKRPPAARNSLGQTKPKGVKAFRMGNLRVLVGRDAKGQTRINWGRVAKAHARLLAAIG